jgi:HEAT repeat protein
MISQAQDVASWLELIGDKAALPSLVQNIGSKQYSSKVIKATVALSGGVAPLGLLEMLKSPCWSKQEGAVTALGEIGDKTVVPALVAALIEAESNITNPPEKSVTMRVHYDVYNAISLALFKLGHPDGDYYYKDDTQTIVTNEFNSDDNVYFEKFTKSKRD